LFCAAIKLQHRINIHASCSSSIHAQHSLYNWLILVRRSVTSLIFSNVWLQICKLIPYGWHKRRKIIHATMINHIECHKALPYDVIQYFMCTYLVIKRSSNVGNSLWDQFCENRSRVPQLCIFPRVINNIYIYIYYVICFNGGVVRQPYWLNTASNIIQLTIVGDIVEHRLL